jgi:hypothetical protein
LGRPSALIAEGRYKRRIIRFLHTGDAPDVLNIIERKRKLKIKSPNLKKEYGNWKNNREELPMNNPEHERRDDCQVYGGNTEKYWTPGKSGAQIWIETEE